MQGCRFTPSRAFYTLQYHDTLQKEQGVISHLGGGPQLFHTTDVCGHPSEERRGHIMTRPSRPPGTLARTFSLVAYRSRSYQVASSHLAPTHVRNWQSRPLRHLVHYCKLHVVTRTSRVPHTHQFPASRIPPHAPPPCRTTPVLFVIRSEGCA